MTWNARKKTRRSPRKLTTKNPDYTAWGTSNEDRAKRLADWKAKALPKHSLGGVSDMHIEMMEGMSEDELCEYDLANDDIGNAP